MIWRKKGLQWLWVALKANKLFRLQAQEDRTDFVIV
jgi:hypothetical protein